MNIRSTLQHAQQGFTLIELMIVVAIIGILSVVALAAYQDYVAKAQISEALSLSDMPKVALTEYYTNYGDWPTSNNEAGLAEPDEITGNYVDNIDVSSGFIEAQFKNSGVASDLQGRLLRLSPIDNQGSISWVCRLNIPVRLLPRACSVF